VCLKRHKKNVQGGRNQNCRWEPKEAWGRPAQCVCKMNHVVNAVHVQNAMGWNNNNNNNIISSHTLYHQSVIIVMVIVLAGPLHHHHHHHHHSHQTLSLLDEVPTAWKVKELLVGCEGTGVAV